MSNQETTSKSVNTLIRGYKREQWGFIKGGKITTYVLNLSFVASNRLDTKMVENFFKWKSIKETFHVTMVCFRIEQLIMEPLTLIAYKMSTK
jgi:hypothetical protein